jgi:hypothetical protein
VSFGGGGGGGGRRGEGEVEDDVVDGMNGGKEGLCRSEGFVVIVSSSECTKIIMM